MRISALALCAGLLLSSIAGVQAATIYKWTDAQGQTHFGSQPPAGQDSERFTTHNRMIPAATGPAAAQKAPMEADIDQKKIDADVRRQVASEQAELREYCVTMRTRLAQLKNNPRLLTEVNGEMVRLSEEERQNRISETEAKINESCNNL